MSSLPVRSEPGSTHGYLFRISTYRPKMDERSCGPVSSPEMVCCTHSCGSRRCGCTPSMNECRKFDEEWTYVGGAMLFVEKYRERQFHVAAIRYGGWTGVVDRCRQRSSSSRHLVSLLPTICTSAAVFTVLSVGRAATAYSNLSERTCRSCRLPTMTF